MNNTFRNVTIGFVLCGSLSLVVSSGIAQQSMKEKLLEQRVAALEAKMAAVEAKLKYVTVDGTDMIISGANLHLRNGAGGMNQKNGLGNFTIGYNIDSGYQERTGSHNLIIGRYLNYTGYGSILTGEENFSRGAYNSILSSYRAHTLDNCDYSSFVTTFECDINTSSSAIFASDKSVVNGNLSSVLGGELNTSDADYSTVVGGKQNKIWFTASHGSLFGGNNNALFEGTGSTITGGYNNIVYGDFSSISGGQGGLIEQYIIGGSISGGDQNTVHNNYSAIGGGANRTTTGNMQFKGGSLTG